MHGSRSVPDENKMNRMSLDEPHQSRLILIHPVHLRKEGPNSFLCN